MSKTLFKAEQAAMYHSAQHPGNLRSGRLFFLAAFAFCGAALVTGFCFVYAVQVGLDRLAFYHPRTDEQTNLGSLHPVTSLSCCCRVGCYDKALVVLASACMLKNADQVCC